MPGKILTQCSDLFSWTLQHGCELDAIMFILQLADPSKYKIRAAFTLGEGTGQIYIEGAMDAETQQLLRLIPGLLFSSGRPHLDSIPIGRVLYEQVPPGDVSATLTPPKDKGYHNEQWVKILRGRYKGDAAFVLSVEPTGCATVLLVPRLQPPIPGLTTGKRKRPGSIPRPPPQLFVPQVVAAAFGAQPKNRRDGLWRFQSSTYDHGLLRKKINPGAAIPFNLVPTNLGIQFASSSHPIFTDDSDVFPRPMEWEFSPNETVIFLTPRHKGQKAVVVEVEEHGLYLELSTGGSVKATWFDVAKDISVGDFIKVISGPKSGKMGWVHSIDQSRVLSIVEKYENNGNMDSINEVGFLFLPMSTTHTVVSHLTSAATA
jgi:ribosomal protein L24